MLTDKGGNGDFLPPPPKKKKKKNPNMDGYGSCRMEWSEVGLTILPRDGL